MRRIFLLVSILGLGCAPYSPDLKVTPTVVVPSDECGEACQYWRGLHCPEGEPTPAGMTCEEVCRNAADNGVDIAKQLSCAHSSSSCAAIRACPY